MSEKLVEFSRVWSSLVEFGPVYSDELRLEGSWQKDKLAGDEASDMRIDGSADIWSRGGYGTMRGGRPMGCRSVWAAQEARAPAQGMSGLGLGLGFGPLHWCRIFIFLRTA